MGRFSATGKSISPDYSVLIAELVDDHPYYVQQLAQQVWLRTNKSVNKEDVICLFPVTGLTGHEDSSRVKFSI